MLLDKLERNRIDDIGCKFLSKAKWPLLKRINLSYNRFGNEGCIHLSKVSWTKLKLINLC
jgi:hypothetical protein